MAYTLAQGRQQIVDALALVAEELGVALAELSEAYEHLDERSAERLEEALFRPLQAAYGRVKGEGASFAERSGLPGQASEAPLQVAPSTPAKALIEGAVARAAHAEGALADLQDSMLPVEVGDDRLRASLAETRRLLAAMPASGRELVRTFGR